MNFPSLTIGGTGPTLHFAHANAYHPKTYLKLLQPLQAHHKIHAGLLRPLWPNTHPNIKSWLDFVDDFIAMMDQKGWKNLIGVGHSLGAIVTLIAAAKRPDLFKKLVLIEPVLLSGAPYFLLKALPIEWRKKYIPIVQTALNRTENWPSKKAAFDYLRPKKIFSQIPDDVFQDIIEYGTKTKPTGGVQLSFPKEWEAHVYATISNAIPYFKQLKIPFMVIRADRTNVIRPNTWKSLQKINANGTFVNIEGASHLLPFEQPELISNMILDFVKD